MFIGFLSAIHTTLLKTKVMILTTADKSYYFTLRKFVRKKKIGPFIDYLQQNFSNARIIIKE